LCSAPVAVPRFFHSFQSPSCHDVRTTRGQDRRAPSVVGPVVAYFRP